MRLMFQIVMHWLFLVCVSESEPVTFDEAQNSENWMAAMQSEYDAIMQNGTWILCDLLLARKPLALNGCIN